MSTAPLRSDFSLRSPGAVPNARSSFTSHGAPHGRPERRPEETVLHRTIDEHWAVLLELAAAPRWSSCSIAAQPLASERYKISPIRAPDPRHERCNAALSEVE